MSTMQTIEIYTDGATSKNGEENATGGWAFVVPFGEDDTGKYFYNCGKIMGATNNICELTAAIKACNFAEKEVSSGSKIIIYSDSAYLINCYQKKWYVNWQRNGWKNTKKNPVANKELWEKLIPYFTDPRFNFIHVDGHANNKYNNIADEIAVKARKGEIITGKEF